MRLLISLTVILLFQTAIAQLSFTDIGSDPAYCRTSSTQSGNGLVYALATGGTPPYSYLWENLGTGQTATTNTWGGLNKGSYRVTVTDYNSSTLTQVVEVDSVSPAANLSLSGTQLSGGGVEYYGTAPLTVTFENLSLWVVNPNNPGGNATFEWQFSQFESFNTALTTADQFHTYDFAGNYGITLRVTNANGCQDESYVQLFLDGPAQIENEAKGTIKVSQLSDLIVVESENENSPKQLKIYDLGGKMIHSESFSAKKHQIEWNFGQGVFLYECLEVNSPESVVNGKILF